MPSRRNPVWIELLQLLPIVSLALPFIVEGKADVARAGPGFLLGALLTLPVSAAVLALKHVFNPILIGAGLWLWLGASAFQLHLESLKAFLAGTQAFSLFLLAVGVGVVTTLLSPHGYVGCRTADARWLKRASLGLLALTAGLASFAWLFRHDVRLGGGAPFIVLNVVRRLLTVRAPD